MILSNVKYAVLMEKTGSLESILGKSQSLDSVVNLKNSTKKKLAPMAEINDDKRFAPRLLKRR